MWIEKIEQQKKKVLVWCAGEVLLPVSLVSGRLSLHKTQIRHSNHLSINDYAESERVSQSWIKKLHTLQSIHSLVESNIYD